MVDLNTPGIVNADENATLSQNSVDDAINQNVEDVLNIYVPLFLSICGIFGNLTNLLIFWKLGFKDSMGVNVFALSLADFLTTFLYAVVCLCYLTNRLYPSSNIDAWALGYFAFGWMMNVMYLSSCWITAVITIERCFCVVFPFQVKLIFTRFRSVVIIIIIYVVNIGLHVPIYVLHKMEWVVTSSSSLGENNVTETPTLLFTTFFAEETARFEMIFDVTVSLALSDVAFSIVLVCTVWMIHKLQTTSKIRLVAPSSLADRSVQKSTLSSKERKLVKVALTLAVTISVCGLPRVIVVTVYNSTPGINTGPLKRYIVIMWAFAYLFTTLGCSITFFVYMALNRSFRGIFYQCFQCPQ